MRLSVGERIVLVLAFAPPAGWFVSFCTAWVMENALDRRPTWSLLWTVGLSVFALVTCLIWWRTGRSNRNASPSSSRGDAESAWVTDEGGCGCDGGEGGCRSGGGD